MTNPKPDGRAGLITMEYLGNLGQLSNKEHELLLSMETVSFINKPIDCQAQRKFQPELG